MLPFQYPQIFFVGERHRRFLPAGRKQRGRCRKYLAVLKPFKGSPKFDQRMNDVLVSWIALRPGLALRPI